MKRTIVTITVAALVALAALTFALCSGPADTPSSPSYLPQR